MLGSNVVEMMAEAARDRRAARADVWDEVWHLMQSGSSKREIMRIAQTRAQELRNENGSD